MHYNKLGGSTYAKGLLINIFSTRRLYHIMWTIARACRVPGRLGAF